MAQESISGLEEMDYENAQLAKVYRNWSSYGLNTGMIDQTTLQYFGDVTGCTVIDFGCGKGSFLKKCVTGGASYCLGLDINESMIKSGGNEVCMDTNRSSGQPRFLIRNCFQPFEDDLGQFDFGLCHFFLHLCSDEAQLAVFLANVFRTIKPGGKFFIGQNPYIAKSVQDQEKITNLCGHLQPMESDNHTGRDPYFVEVPAFFPNLATATGRPFSRKQIFTFPDYYWSKEKVMGMLRQAGFINVVLLSPTFSDEVPEFEREQIEGLKEPFMMIGAQKPNFGILV